MFKKITTATVVLSGLLLSGTASANEVSLEQFVGSLVAQAVSATKQELTYKVQEAVLTANNNITMESEEEFFATHVTITDMKEESNQAE